MLWDRRAPGAQGGCWGRDDIQGSYPDEKGLTSLKRLQVLWIYRDLKLKSLKISRNMVHGNHDKRWKIIRLLIPEEMMLLLSDLRWGSGISKKPSCLFPQAGRDWKHWHRVCGEKPQVKLQPFSKCCLVPSSSDSHVSSMGQHCGLHQALWKGALFVFNFPFPQKLCQH